MKSNEDNNEKNDENEGEKKNKKKHYTWSKDVYMHLIKNNTK
jgi:hypothetical protein